MKKIQLAILMVTAGFAIQSQAALFDITFTGGATSGSGQITATPEGGGIYLATSGFFTVVPGGAFDPITYSLVPGTSPVVQNIIGTTGLNLSGDNLITFPGNPFLDPDGLVFDTVLGNKGPVINLWGNGANSYTLYGTADGSGGFTYPDGLGVNGGATIALDAVPEPSTIIAGLLLLLPFGASAIRSLRRNRAP